LQEETCHSGPFNYIPLPSPRQLSKNNIYPLKSKCQYLFPTNEQILPEFFLYLQKFYIITFPFFLKFSLFSDTIQLLSYNFSYFTPQTAPPPLSSRGKFVRMSSLKTMEIIKSEGRKSKWILVFMKEVNRYKYNID
jgi:hypothetical protein